MALCSLWLRAEALGDNGVLPASGFPEAVHATFESGSYWTVPTLLWFGMSFHWVFALGTLCALVGLAGKSAIRRGRISRHSSTTSRCSRCRRCWHRSLTRPEYAPWTYNLVFRPLDAEPTVLDWIDDPFNGKRPRFVRILPIGTSSQDRPVWMQLRAARMIPDDGGPVRTDGCGFRRWFAVCRE